MSDFYMNAGAFSAEDLDAGGERVPAAVASKWKGIIVHVGLSPNAPTILQAYLNGVAVSGSQVTLPDAHPADTGLELLWPNPITLAIGDAVHFQGDGGPTNTVPAWTTYRFERV